ncbi:hypothetical protein Ahy_A05g022494 isoform A [Arachis hypogaea]|uniref:Pop1 N-terminal domain-containing protein n=1 Tax=Arachis hypogaea TaxID=3818 RepID=A0A445D150_ARAHY|nr:hypothetical protein Ahy_A05g022494 isoform A [Arachis hypogaea]
MQTAEPPVFTNQRKKKPPPPPNGVSHCRRPWFSEASLFVLSAFSKSNPLFALFFLARRPSSSSCSPSSRRSQPLSVVLLSVALNPFRRMVTEGTEGPKFSADMATRKINVQKFAESRAYELESLQSVIADRVKGGYRSQKQEKTNNKAGTRRKRQKLGTGHNKTCGVELLLGKDEIKKLPSRRMRRRYELKMNFDSGFSTSGDGIKRLRTHVWHTKRYTMTKLWGYYLPLALQGRGKGSRAVLKRLKRGVVVHDASYYTAVQVEGPELLSSQDLDESVWGTTCGMAMLYQVEVPVSQPIGPVTYMWRPTFQQNISREHDISD